jgi:hypothetical protein
MLCITTGLFSDYSSLLDVKASVGDDKNQTTATPSATGSNNMTGPKFLFIQSAQSGSVSEINATTSTLQLSDVSDRTILFSDRPDRIVSSVNTTDFIGNWSSGPDSFAEDPPNAVLILDDVEQQRQDFVIIELFNPEYYSEANTLSYNIRGVNATATTISSIGLPGGFGQSTLVIDNQYSITVPNNSVNYSGDTFQKSP